MDWFSFNQSENQIIPHWAFVGPCFFCQNAESIITLLCYEFCFGSLLQYHGTDIKVQGW